MMSTGPRRCKSTSPVTSGIHTAKTRRFARGTAEGVRRELVCKGVCWVSVFTRRKHSFYRTCAHVTFQSTARISDMLCKFWMSNCTHQMNVMFVTAHWHMRFQSTARISDMLRKIPMSNSHKHHITLRTTITLHTHTNITFNKHHITLLTTITLHFWTGPQNDLFLTICFYLFVL